MKVGRTDGDVIIRIVHQINESTPDKPILSLIIRTTNARALERGLQAVLELRGRKVEGGGVAQDDSRGTGCGVSSIMKGPA